jgi:hypothetical protein
MSMSKSAFLLFMSKPDEERGANGRLADSIESSRSRVHSDKVRQAKSGRGCGSNSGCAQVIISQKPFCLADTQARKRLRWMCEEVESPRKYASSAPGAGELASGVNRLFIMKIDHDRQC